MSLRMLFPMSECVSPVKTGQADVAGALPAALRRVTLDVRVPLFGVARRHHAPRNVAAELMQGLSTQIPRLRLHPLRWDSSRHPEMLLARRNLQVVDLLGGFDISWDVLGRHEIFKWAGVN